MTATPVPAGALTVDPLAGDRAWVRYADNGQTVMLVNAEQRARLLAGPTRPDGVPEDAVPVTLWFGPENKDGLCLMYPPSGGRKVADAIEWSLLGVPVPPHQPDPDPEALLVEKIAATYPPTGPADGPSEPQGCPACGGTHRHPDDAGRCGCGFLLDDPLAPPSAAGERIGPLGLSEKDTRYVADNWNPDITDSAWRRAEGVLAVACRAAVAEWDAEPAETLADVLSEMWTAGLDGWVCRIEAASRPDPDTITVNRDDLTISLDPDAPNAARSIARIRLRAALAAAGLPQEPTDD